MKCPHCNERFGLFSEELKEIGKVKVCPECKNGVFFGIRNLWFYVGFAFIAIPAFLLDLSGPIAAGIAGGVGGLLGFGLKKRKG